MSRHLLQSRRLRFPVSQGISHQQHNDLALLYLKRRPACASRRFSADAATTLRRWWRTTSARGSSCSPSPAPRPLLCTTSRTTSSSASCITSTPTTLRLVSRILTFLFLSRLETLIGSDCLGYETKSNRNIVSLFQVGN